MGAVGVEQDLDACKKLSENIKGENRDFPVGDAKVSEMGSGMTGKTSSGVKASTAELTSHYAEGRWVKVGN